jgi:[methyl-Co(III) methanol-specific corrinoid protein]:coenzyme M methyltransferase
MAIDIYSPKERLLRKLHGEGVERPPVICPGGMMNAAVVDIMEDTGRTLPGGHFDADLMAEIARDISQMTGFENYGVPFCMTVEAEALGSEIDPGDLSCEPKIVKELYPSVAAAASAFSGTRGGGARLDVVASAVSKLSGGDVPVIGSITGPISTAASIVDPMTFLKELRKDRENAHRVLSSITGWLKDYSLMLCEAGADVICIADPTATGEILGPKVFEEYAVQYLNRLIDEIRRTGVPVIAHVCGQLSSVSQQVASLGGNAVSTDAMVSLRDLKDRYPHLTTMGNLSTIKLEQGAPESVRRSVDLLLRDGVDILAPACGLSTSTPLDNIKAFTGQVKAE